MQRAFRTELRIQGGKVSDEKIPTKRVYNKLNAKHIVSLDEFKNYLAAGNTLLNQYFSKRKQIEINNAVYIMKKRFTKYESPDSDRQFQTLYKSADLHNRSRLTEMLHYFVGPMWAKIILVMIQFEKTDHDIFTFIKMNFKSSESFQTKLYRMLKISDLLQRHTPSSGSDLNLLYIGVGNGAKTLQLKELLGCNVYGADLESWGPYGQTRHFRFPFKKIQQNPYRIGYPDKMFGCITLILTLHHAKDVLEVIRECKRLLTDDGIIAIVEHDMWSDESNMLIDLQHRIYSTIYEEPGEYFGSYYNFYEWDVIFHKCGMAPVYASNLTDDVTNFWRYDVQFIGIYKKA
jgi:ubiquinone/menaquinone biosynthesis C-methylase UbiE